MKKTLIALAVLGAAAGVAHAQSNVTIYGVVDTGYIKETGRDVRMGENINNRIGFRGAEDLGGGLKATFELEKRFDLFDGTNGNTNTAQYKGPAKASGKDWDGAANIGLAGDWGRIRFGRVNELSTETIRKFDPFYQYGVGSMILSTQRSARIDNTARYDSPKWAGFSFGLSYSLGENTKAGSAFRKAKDNAKNEYIPGVIEKDDGSYEKFTSYDNDGYGINLSYDNGPFLATANWSRVADSNDSSVWNIGVGYKFGPARVTLAYEKTKDKGYKNGSAGMTASIPYANKYTDISGYYDDVDVAVQSEQEVWLLGLEWDVGPGQFDASVQYGQLDDVKAGGKKIKYTRVRGGKEVTKTFDDRDILKYAIGYTYNLSKRTSAYAQVSYTDYDDKDAGRFYTGMDRDSVTAFQIGMTHKF
ncbi:MAG: porin [Alistipes senegalensis]|nr:porin [Oxalobacter formigenes]MCM1280447.1 porin [Alistipes senegalensis]